MDALLTARHLPVVAYCCRGDTRWQCVSVSESIQTKFGISPEAWTADPHVWLEHVHPDDREHLVLDRITAIDERRKLSTEYRLRTHDGRYRWVHDEAELVLVEENQPHMYGVITDITPRRHSDVILSELYEASRGQVSRLQDQVDERDLFARLLAHDLRMPLTAASAALALVGTAEEAVDGEALTRAQQAIDHAHELVSCLLELDRWSGERVLRVEPANLLDVAKLATEMIDFDDRELVVDMPDTRATLDAVLISRALANLVDNAVKHSPSGGIVRLRAYEQLSPHSVIFSVEDEGLGIPESIRDDIFRPFVSSRIDHGDSHGLGLTLVRRMAQLHGGRVWFEELPTGGVAFHLLVPQA